MQIVPLIQYPNQELMCILGNQNCTIRVTVRSGYTFLDLRVDDTVIREGQLCDPWSWVLATPNDFKGNAIGGCCITSPRKRPRRLTRHGV